MPRSGADALDRVVGTGGRLLVAGTLDIYSAGLGLAMTEVVERLRQEKVQGVVLGGDTVAEIKYQGATSTGGGSALYFAAYGTTCVLDALKRNKQEITG
jgi:phosphoglycerate kinase